MCDRSAVLRSLWRLTGTYQVCARSLLLTLFSVWPLDQADDAEKVVPLHAIILFAGDTSFSLSFWRRILARCRQQQLRWAVSFVVRVIWPRFFQSLLSLFFAHSSLLISPLHIRLRLVKCTAVRRDAIRSVVDNCS